MRRSTLLLLLFTTAAAARVPVPAVTDGVSDRETLRVLAAEYGGRPRLQGSWSGRTDATIRRSVCTDSGVGHGDRYVAVCSAASDDAGARVADLYVIEPPVSSRGKARIRARFRGVDAGNGVRLLAIAPDRAAFAVPSSTVEPGWRREYLALYAERGRQLRALLSLATHVDNRGSCTPGDDRAGRRCRRRMIALDCTLRAAPVRVDAGAWPLELVVRGEREGETVDRVVPIPHDAYGYRVSARVLETQGCDIGH